ncbi:MAG: hypothetical protein WBE80_14410 [Methylocella sp.]
MPRKVEAEISAARAGRETVEMFRLRPVYAGLKSAEDDAWRWLPRLPGTAQTGVRRAEDRLPRREVLGTNSIRPGSRLRVAPVHRDARFRIIHDY